MAQTITCTRVGVYRLTRGVQYEMLAHDAEKRQVKVRSADVRSRWFPESCFDLNDSPVTVLLKWRFDDPVIDELNGRDERNNRVDITMELSDGTWRWCQMTTPDFLKALLEKEFAEPVIYARNLIVVRDLSVATVGHVLEHLDQQGDLTEYSLPLELNDESECL